MATALLVANFGVLAVAAERLWSGQERERMVAAVVALAVAPWGACARVGGAASPHQKWVAVAATLGASAWLAACVLAGAPDLVPAVAAVALATVPVHDVVGTEVALMTLLSVTASVVSSWLSASPIPVLVTLAVVVVVLHLRHSVVVASASSAPSKSDATTLALQPHHNDEQVEVLLISLAGNDEHGTASQRADLDAALDALELKRVHAKDRVKAAKLDPSQVSVHGRVAVGSFGEVHRGTWLETGAAVAVKRVTPSRSSRTVAAALLNEVDLSRGMSHPCLVRVLGWCSDPCLSIVYEFMDGGSLREFLNGVSFAGAGVGEGEAGANERPMKWSHTKTRLAVDAAAALAFLHARGVVHRDVKPDNLLVRVEHRSSSGDGDVGVRCKLTDLGSAVRVGEAVSSAAGTALWTAPEVARDASASAYPPADIWSFGLVLSEMLTHALPFTDLSSGASVFFGPSGGVSVPSPLPLLREAVRAVPAHELDPLVPAVLAVVERCCALDPADRPDARLVMFSLLELLVTVDGVWPVASAAAAAAAAAVAGPAAPSPTIPSATTAVSTPNALLSTAAPTSARRRPSSLRATPSSSSRSRRWLQPTQPQPQTNDGGGSPSSPTSPPPAQLINTNDDQENALPPLNLGLSPSLTTAKRNRISDPTSAKKTSSSRRLASFASSGVGPGPAVPTPAPSDALDHVV